MEYNAKDSVSFDDIVAFHAEFEYIHPFQDKEAIKEMLNNPELKLK